MPNITLCVTIEHFARWGCGRHPLSDSREDVGETEVFFVSRRRFAVSVGGLIRQKAARSAGARRRPLDILRRGPGALAARWGEIIAEGDPLAL